MLYYSHLSNPPPPAEWAMWLMNDPLRYGAIPNLRWHCMNPLPPTLTFSWHLVNHTEPVGLWFFFKTCGTLHQPTFHLAARSWCTPVWQNWEPNMTSPSDLFPFVEPNFGALWQTNFVRWIGEKFENAFGYLNASIFFKVPPLSTLWESNKSIWHLCYRLFMIFLQCSSLNHVDWIYLGSFINHVDSWGGGG